METRGLWMLRPAPAPVWLPWQLGVAWQELTIAPVSGASPPWRLSGWALSLSHGDTLGQAHSLLPGAPALPKGTPLPPGRPSRAPGARIHDWGAALRAREPEARECPQRLVRAPTECLPKLKGEPGTLVPGTYLAHFLKRFSFHSQIKHVPFGGAPPTGLLDPSKLDPIFSLKLRWSVIPFSPIRQSLARSSALLRLLQFSNNAQGKYYRLQLFLTSIPIFFPLD